jgi:hypothetical protein
MFSGEISSTLSSSSLGFPFLSSPLLFGLFVSAGIT